MTWQLLFIDDIPEDAEIAVWQLRQAGIDCEFRVVSSPGELLDAFEDCAPQLVLCDLVLPGFDCWSAWEVCQRMGVPMVIYSGTVSVSDAQRAASLGVFGTAEKDLPGQLLALVRRALGIQ